jgi:mRNA-degrading endonuclease toxin of MazEF toxin-antitoxin module
VTEARRLRWAMMLVDLDPVEGHEQGGQRRALIVSYEPLHAGGMMMVCPVTAARSEPRRPGEVAIPVGEAGQTKAGLVLCHQVRTISALRARAMLTGAGAIPYVTDPEIRTAVRQALAFHLGLDIAGWQDGASADDHFGPVDD